jgi:hypothetical protein
MEGSDQLLTIAEIGATFAGFTAIVGLIANSARGNLGAKLNFWLMIEFSFATIVFALIPLTLFNFGVAPHYIWTASSLSIAVFLILHGILIRKHVAEAIARSQLSIKSPLIIVPLFAVTIVIQVLNALGIVFDRTYAAFFLGIFLFLLIAFGNFVLLLNQLWLAGNEDESS